MIIITKKVFIHAELEPGTQIIDESVIEGALTYVINNQLSSGVLPIVGRVHSLGLLVSSSVNL